MALPYHLWTGVAYYGGFGALLSVQPWLTPRLNRLHSHSLRVQVAFALVAATALPVIVLMAGAAEREQRLTTVQALANQRTLAAILAQDVADYIAGHRGAVAALAAQPGQLQDSAARQRARLQALARTYPGITSFATFDAAGAPIARADDLPGSSVAGFPVYEDARRTGGPALDILISPVLHRPVFSFGAPIADVAGQFGGVAVIALESGRVAEVLARASTSAGQSVEVYLVDTRGRVIAHRDAGLVAAFADVSGTPPVAALLSEAARGEDGLGVVAYGVTPGEQLAAYARVPALGWGVIVERPAAAALAGVYTSRESAFALLLLCVAAAAVGGATASGRLVAPLGTLSRAAERLAAGDAAAPLPPGHSSEVAQLTRSLAAMRDRLVARTAALTRAEVSARSGEARFRALLESAPDAIVIANAVGEIVLINRRTEQLFGYQRDELVGQPVERLVPEPQRAAHPAHRADYAVRPAARAMGAGRNLRARRKDGTEFAIEVSLSPVESDGELLVVSAIRDVSARKHLEQSLLAANAELEQFAHTVSHDLKAPLVSIQGFAHFLAEDYGNVLDSTGREYLARIETNVTRLTGLIQDVLTFSRVGHVGAVPAALDLDAAVANTFLDLDGLRVSTGAAVRVRGPLPVVVASQTLVGQILTNLLSNAMIYGSLPGAAPHIEIGCNDLDDRWELYVRDHGPGIPATYQQLVFRLFERLPGAVEANPDGTGLGLGIVRRAAEAMGGTVALASAPGLGATFTVAIPKLPAARGGAAEPPEPLRPEYAIVSAGSARDTT